MNKFVSVIIFVIITSYIGSNQGGVNKYTLEIKSWQSSLDKEFADSTASCLIPEDRAIFHGLDFYSIDYKYCVTAGFERTKDEKEFGMKTTTDRLPIYIRYGIAHFRLNGKDLKINIYKNVKLSQKDKYKDYLFMLFTDVSSGKQSYAGGRYIDLRIPEGDEIIIDFNKSYNPYCAYNHKYSCPIPPDDDYLDIKILAGCKKGFH